MNKDNKELLFRMKKLQYYNFIRYALGMKYYLINNGCEILNKIDDKEKNETAENEGEKSSGNIRTLAYLYDSEKKEKQNTFFISGNDFEEKCFHDETENRIDAKSFFDDVGDFLLWSIMMGVLGVESFSASAYRNDLDIGKYLFEKNKPYTLRFILGAGINHGLGLGDWGKLIDDLRNSISTLTGTPVEDKTKGLIKFENSMSNTNYIAPQILKDLDSKKYYNVIYSSLYSSFDPEKTNKSLNPSIEDSTLFQIARILASEGKSVVLTFNYDNVLEQVLEHNFTTPYYSDYYNSRKQTSGIRIVHSHGFYPYVTSGTRKSHSIVFSCFEYMDGYLKPQSYARKRLHDHIKQPCILVGNSLSDYEEQKVFYHLHSTYLSRYSYIFTTKSDSADQWMDIYKSIYFISMGVIPVFFDDFNQMANYLKTL